MTTTITIAVDFKNIAVKLYIHDVDDDFEDFVGASHVPISIEKHRQCYIYMIYFLYDMGDCFSSRI